MIDTDKDLDRVALDGVALDRVALDRALAELFAEQAAADGAEGHGDPEEIAAYLAGELGEEEAERLRRHLGGCRECTALVLDLETLAADEPAADGVADFELAAAWRTFEERRAAAPPAAGRPATAPTARRQAGWLQAAAAVLLLSTVGLSTWVVRLRHELAAPQPNVPILYLGAATRAEGGVGRLEADPNQDFFVLMLAPPREFADYEVEILDPGGRQVWRGAGLVASDFGTVRLGLSRRRLPAGEVRVRLYGIAGEERQLLEDYRVEIR